jgi:hypothetical protein
MRATALALAFTLILVVAPSAPAAAPPSSSAATAAFGRLLHKRFGEIHGFWTCPSAQVIGSRIDCLAEARAGQRWHMTSASASLRRGRVVISQVRDIAWVRRWSPYSRHFILRSREPQVPGVISVNSPAYDWGFLFTACDSDFRPGRTTRCTAYDGNGSGLFRFFMFTCLKSGQLVTCINSLGDSVRYKPRVE